ncbi:ras-domain-containing protein, partial [Mycena latifolia]
GRRRVGNLSLLVHLTDQRFLANPDPTLGLEFGSKLLMLPDGEGPLVKLLDWSEYGAISHARIRVSDILRLIGCILVYDVTSRRSFDNVRTWLVDVRAHADAHISCILVGNKVDLCEGDEILHAIPASEGTLLAAEEGLRFAEASAKNGSGVEETFVRAAERVLEKVRWEVFDDSRPPGVKLFTPDAALPAQQKAGGGQC